MCMIPLFLWQNCSTRGGNKVKEKRVVLIAYLILAIFGLFTLRLADIALFHTRHFSSHNINLIKQSVEERSSSFTINDGRGMLVDRQGEPLTEIEKQALVLFPFLKYNTAAVENLAEIIHIPVQDILKTLKEKKEPFAFHEKSLTLSETQISAIENMETPGLQVLKVSSPLTMQHIPYIYGMTGENAHLAAERYKVLISKGVIDNNNPIGLMGMEGAYDPFLLSTNQEKLTYETTAKGKLLFGGEAKVTKENDDGYGPLVVKSTEDKKIQQKAENIADQEGLLKGGIVLLDAKTSGLLAMVSRPALDRKHPFKAKNAMLTTQFPGSVFKTVVAAAAIDHNLYEYNKRFDCDNNMYGTGMDERKLGNLTFSQSFYESCNYTFATLAKSMMKTDPDIINRYAAELGLTQKNGWTGKVFQYKHFQQFPEEKRGSVWANKTDRFVPKAVAQTAVGQLNVKVTPLAVANMMAAISRGGIKMAVRSATGISYRDMENVKLTSFSGQELPGQNLSPYTVMRLQELLKGVVNNPAGTAHSLANLPYTVAGKTGTAETGDKDGHTNHWFAGYFPANHPQYAMVVVDLDKHKGSDPVFSIYKRMVSMLYNLEQQSAGG